MYKNIVVTLDGSELAETAVEHAETIARGCQDPQITLLRVIEPVRIPYGEATPGLSIPQLGQLEKDEKAKAEKYLNKIAAKLTVSGIKTSVKIMNGPAAETIADFVDKSQVDLVIMATHGRSGLSRWVWGSVADRILHGVCVPVLMVRVTDCGNLYKK
ncbi:MAG: universal stress protein [Dehalococcoidia bacterium]|jgi:nucleotide-binding universal stress UspA family protein